MKTRRILATTSAMLIMLAIIGAGFSYWFFGTNVVKEEKTVTGNEVTQLVKVGDVTPADDFHFIFDQTETGRKNNGNNVTFGTNDEMKGITLSLGTNTKATYTMDTNAPEGAGYTFTVTVSIPENLAEYFDITASDSDNWTANRTDATGSATEIVFTSTTDKEFDWATDVTLTYKTEPATEEAYNTFKGIAQAAEIKVTYTAPLDTAVEG